MPKRFHSAGFGNYAETKPHNRSQTEAYVKSADARVESM